jgi:DNA repair exonuclease SbcCD ATPase subunit
MKHIPFVILLVIFALGCNQDRIEKLETQNTTLETSNHQLTQDIASRDEYVDRVADAINEVYTSIEDVKAKENSLLRETSEMERNRKLTHEELRSSLMDRINVIRATLSDNHKRLAEMETKLTASKSQYAGLRKIVNNLKKTLEERDHSIADLGTRVSGLEQQVNEKSLTIVKQDSVIGDQYKQITTVYYVAGTRDQLEKMGIITKEGGFLWGLLGSTTTMTNTFDDKFFKAFNKVVENSIRVEGKIDEIIPKRNELLYQKTELAGDQSMLTITHPDNFWKDKYLVIITDKPTSMDLSLVTDRH